MPRQQAADGLLGAVRWKVHGGRVDESGHLQLIVELLRGGRHDERPATGILVLYAASTGLRRLTYRVGVLVVVLLAVVIGKQSKQ